MAWLMRCQCGAEIVNTHYRRLLPIRKFFTFFPPNLKWMLKEIKLWEIGIHWKGRTIKLYFKRWPIRPMQQTVNMQKWSLKLLPYLLLVYTKPDHMKLQNIGGRIYENNTKDRKLHILWKTQKVIVMSTLNISSDIPLGSDTGVSVIQIRQC